MAEREEQERILTYRILESRLDGLLKQRDLVLNKIAEIQSTLSTIDEVEKKNGDILIPIGGEAYTHGKLLEKKTFIVEIGANVALEKNVEEAKTILNKRQEELMKAVNDLQKEIQKVSFTLQQLAMQIQQPTTEETKAG